MTSEERNQVKEKIQKEINVLEDKIAELKELTQPIAPENAIGRVSRMDAINNKSINEAALRKSEETLKRLKHAAQKVDDKDFGTCIRCKQPIPIGRLMLVPFSPRCVHCASS